MADRADPFDNDLDLSGFTPKKPAAKEKPEAVRKVAETASFQSREPAAPQPVKEEARRERRLYRTGRNALFSCKATPETVDEFYRICNARNWVMGETLERAVAALKRELEAVDDA